MNTSGQDIFQAIADPTRRQILQLLSAGSMTINALSDQFDMSRPAVSKHLKVLHDSGMINIKDVGRERHCMLDASGFQGLSQWLKQFGDIINPPRIIEDVPQQKGLKPATSIVIVC